MTDYATAVSLFDEVYGANAHVNGAGPTDDLVVQLFESASLSGSRLREVEACGFELSMMETVDGEYDFAGVVTFEEDA